jgi:hypothetical protein
MNISILKMRKQDQAWWLTLAIPANLEMEIEDCGPRLAWTKLTRDTI